MPLSAGVFYVFLPRMEIDFHEVFLTKFEVSGWHVADRSLPSKKCLLNTLILPTTKSVDFSAKAVYFMAKEVRRNNHKKAKKGAQEENMVKKKKSINVLDLFCGCGGFQG